VTKLILALDVPSYDDAMQFVESIEGNVHLDWVKVGLELFISDGQRVMDAMSKAGFNIMLDLKLHDIPETVARATARAADLGADMLTIHAAGGPAMIAAAKKAAGDTKILAVTVLTSLDEDDLVKIGHSPTPHKTLVRDLVLRRLRLAEDNGADGVVCSPLEVQTLKMNVIRGMLFVTPGIRPSGGDTGDQKRVATPTGAREAGASFIVVGRPIRDAKDRVAAVKGILAELTT
jgi:orotidine-5'-phosphate decarboxylase